MEDIGIANERCDLIGIAIEQVNELNKGGILYEENSINRDDLVYDISLQWL